MKDWLFLTVSIVFLSSPGLFSEAMVCSFQTRLFERHRQFWSPMGEHSIWGSKTSQQLFRFSPFEPLPMSSRITTTCPACRAKLAVGSENAGKRLRCPKCRGSVVVPKEEVISPEPEFDFSMPAIHEDDNSIARDEVYENDPYPSKPPSFRSRTSNLAREFKDELIQPDLIPQVVARLVANDEQFLFASNPSQTALVFRLILSGLASLIANPILFSIPALESSTARITAAVVGLLWILTVLYITYVAWRTSFFAITSRRIIVRTGWFNHIISMAPVHNIQMVTINTGFVDRWLGLNSVCFETAAASGFGVLRTGVLMFTNIHSDEVMTAYSQALGKQIH